MSMVATPHQSRSIRKSSTLFGVLITRALITTAALGLVLFTSGCAPRGESKSLDEILVLARDRFSSIQKRVPTGALSAEASKSLEQVTKAIEGTIVANSTTEQAAQAKAIGVAFSELLPKAGYTSRAALAEVQKQYVQLAESVSSEGAGLAPAADQVARARLAATRAYTVLASELETTEFGL